MTDDPATRGQRVYDRWARLGFPYRLVDRATRGLRNRAVAALSLSAGDVALDLGCGPGGSLDGLAGAVRPGGSVLGVDYSRGMVRRAGRRVRASPEASVLRADATALPVAADSVDGVLASLALSAVPGLEAALDEVARVLSPGGRFVVLDARVPDGPLGRLLYRGYRRLVNVQHPDVLARLRARFGSVELLRTFDAELGFLARVET